MSPSFTRPGLPLFTCALDDGAPARYWSHRAQQRFLAQVARSNRIEVVLGRHEPRVDQETGRRYHVEKETDVNLAVDMVVGAYTDRYDVALLVAGDTDYVRAVKAPRERGKQLVWCHLPQQKHTDQLAQLADGMIELSAKFVRTCAMPDR
ncbi:MAG TPA: NYN domain-containing protein [Longimicrobium sp.]|nr:NYN domain-containing protein [Longimicrobium sp.]